MEVVKRHSYKIHKFDHIQDYIVTDSNKDILNYMSSSYRITNFKNIRTYDFQTLYIKIPQDKLKENLEEFIKYVFQVKESKYINIRNEYAVFSNTKSTKFSFTEVELIRYLNYSIDNTFVSFCNQVYRQSIGIPMGRMMLHTLANIFLHMYEKAFFQHLQDNYQPEIITKFGNPYRFQDDLIIFGIQPQGNMRVHNIYPEEMVIKNTNISHTKVTYLDIGIVLKDHKYVYKSYDKRKDFIFPIIKYLNLNGNIPINPAYGVFISQLIRFCTINLLLEDFKNDA